MSPGVIVPGMLTPSEGAMNGVITGEIFMVPSPTEESKAFIDAYPKKCNVSPGKGNLVIFEAVQPDRRRDGQGRHRQRLRQDFENDPRERLADSARAS